MPNNITASFARHLLLLGLLSLVVTTFSVGNPFVAVQRYSWAVLGGYYLKSFLASALVWLANASISPISERYASWMDEPGKRLAIVLTLTLVFTTVVWFAVVAIYVVPEVGWSMERYWRGLHYASYLITILITFAVSGMMYGRQFLLAWKQTAIEAERLKKEQATARYEALKNQVNPHFLFNSLNVLTALVHIDPQKAEQFIRRLSTVYRYILESRDKDVVPLEEELTILRAYIFLMETRFGAGFKADIRLPEPAQGQIAPLTLQLLVENALKHNEAGKSAPLLVEIYAEHPYIVVRNNLQSRSILPESTGVGLSNIRARYAVLATEPVLIDNHDGFFTVKIPLL